MGNDDLLALCQQWIKDVCEEVLHPLSMQDEGGKLGMAAECFGQNKYALTGGRRMPKIVQFDFKQDTEHCQGAILGLGDDGCLYDLRNGRWQPDTPPPFYDGPTPEEKYQELKSAVISDVLGEESKEAIAVLAKNGDWNTSNAEGELRFWSAAEKTSTPPPCYASASFDLTNFTLSSHPTAFA